MSTFRPVVVSPKPYTVLQVTGGGTHSGVLNTPMSAIPPTGKSIELKFAEFFIMRDDKIKTLRA